MSYPSLGGSLRVSLGVVLESPLAHSNYASRIAADYASGLTNIKRKRPERVPGVFSLVQRQAVAKE
jgi:hypothetical protein